MTFIYAFLFSGILCLIGQLILDNTKLTPGHVNSIFVVLGAVLGALGLYQIFYDYAGAGAVTPITNFGNILYEGAITGFKESGVIGLFENILVPASAGLSVTVLISFIVALLSKPKN